MEEDLTRVIELEERPKKKKKSAKGILIWALIIAVVLVAAFVLSGIFGGSGGYGHSGDYGSPFVGVLYVEGTIGSGNVDSLGIRYGYQHQWTMNMIDELIADEDNAGLLLFVDSPGGGVYESDELYLKLKEYKDRTGRPVYSAMGGMAASGGYYISLAADKIYANRNTWTGSIGVTIGTLYDVSGLLDQFGVKTVTIAEGANKSMGSGTEPLTEEQEGILRGLVHESYMQFVTILSDERKIPMNQAQTIADGRIYSAKQAADLNLIDGVKTLEDSKKAMLTDEKLINCDFLDIVYQDHSFMGRMLASVNAAKATESDLSIVMEIISKGREFPVAYLYQQ